MGKVILRILLICILTVLFSRPIFAAPIIDGDGSDWTVYDTLIQDDVGDSKCGDGTDIKEYYLYVEGNYLYVMLKVQGGAINASMTLESYLDFADGKRVDYTETADVGMNFHLDGGNPWLSVWDSSGGIAVNEYELAFDNVIEAKIPLSVFGTPAYFNLESCKTWTTHYSDTCDELLGNDMIDYFSIQRRHYESGDQTKVCAFSIKKQAGMYYQGDEVANMILTNPSGNEVTIASCSFDTLMIIFGQYDSGSGSWNYPSNADFVSEYICDFTEEVQTGTYQLQLNMNDGLTLNSESDFNGAVDLPFIEADNITYANDSNGLTINYEVPLGINPTLNVSSKAYIECYKNETIIAEINVGIPVDLGYVFMPKSFIQILKSHGVNKLKVRLQVRTNDNNNRNYSNYSLYKLTTNITAPLTILLLE